MSFLASKNKKVFLFFKLQKKNNVDKQKNKAVKLLIIKAKKQSINKKCFYARVLIYTFAKNILQHAYYRNCRRYWKW